MTVPSVSAWIAILPNPSEARLYMRGTQYQPQRNETLCTMPQALTVDQSIIVDNFLHVWKSIKIQLGGKMKTIVSWLATHSIGVYLSSLEKETLLGVYVKSLQHGIQPPHLSTKEQPLTRRGALREYWGWWRVHPIQAVINISTWQRTVVIGFPFPKPSRLLYHFRYG